MDTAPRQGVLAADQLPANLVRYLHSLGKPVSWNDGQHLMSVLRAGSDAVPDSILHATYCSIMASQFGKETSIMLALCAVTWSRPL